MRQNNIFTFCRRKVSLSELFSSKKWWVSSHELFYHRKNFLFARFIPFTFSNISSPTPTNPSSYKNFFRNILTPSDNGTFEHFKIFEHCSSLSCKVLLRRHNKTKPHFLFILRAFYEPLTGKKTRFYDELH